MVSEKFVTINEGSYIVNNKCKGKHTTSWVNLILKFRVQHTTDLANQVAIAVS